jgi:hypothetical protein
MSTQTSNQSHSAYPRLSTNSIATVRLGILIFIYIALVVIAYLLNRNITLIDPQEILGWDLRDFYHAASLASNSQNPYLTSKFVTPPLSLMPAKALLLFEFPTATLVWMGVNILFLLGGLWIALRSLNHRRAFFITAAFTALAFPTQMLLERGNIDGLIFFGLALCLYSNSSLVKSTSFVVIVLTKVYPILLAPFFILTVKRFWLYAGVMAILCFAIFSNEFIQYLPNLNARVNTYRFSENMSPHGLFHFLSMTLERQWQSYFYVYAIPYVLVNVILDWKILKNDTQNQTILLLGSFWVIPMLFFPSVVYAYSGIILLLPMLAIDTLNISFSKKIIVLIAAMETLLMFPTVGFAKVTGFELWYAIPPLMLWIASLVVIIWKIRLIRSSKLT